MLDKLFESLWNVFQENFVLIIVAIIAISVIGYFFRKLIGFFVGFFMIAIALSVFAGDDTMLNTGTESVKKVSDSLEKEAENSTFKRTSKTTFELETPTMTIKGNEETKKAEVQFGKAKPVTMNLETIYKIVDPEIRKQINM